MKTILFDTDVLIELLRGNAKVAEQVDREKEGAMLFCSVITVAEIYAGMFPREKESTDLLLNSLVKVPVSEAIAKQAGIFRNSHKQLELMDCLIAATTLSLDAELLTKNGKHYPMKEIQMKVIK